MHKIDQNGVPNEWMNLTFYEGLSQGQLAGGERHERLAEWRNG